uniref:Ribosomal RNA-processing protein 42 n=1 Tax=Trichuris muris TaxID=70415 RepID=A0A5S6Q868_TRIMR
MSAHTAGQVARSSVEQMDPEASLSLPKDSSPGNCVWDALSPSQQNNTEERLQSVAFHLASAFRANSAPALRSLCVKPGQLCWYVKVIIEAVLHMLRLPVVGVASSRKKGTTAVELNQDPDAFVSIDMSNVPLLATVARINSYCLVDPTEMELFAADSIAVVGVNRQCNDTAGRICYFSKDLSNSMDLSSTVDMMNEGCLVISCIAPALLEILDDPERISVEGRKLRLNREAEQ